MQDSEASPDADARRSSLHALEAEVESRRQAVARCGAVRSSLLRQWQAARQCYDDAWRSLEEMRSLAADCLELPPMPLAWADLDAHTPWARLVEDTEAAPIVQALIANWSGISRARIVVERVTRLEHPLLWRYYQARKAELLADAAAAVAADDAGAGPSALHSQLHSVAHKRMITAVSVTMIAHPLAIIPTVFAHTDVHRLCKIRI